MPQERLLTLYPLKFNEALADLLKTKPMPKPPKKQRAKSKVPTRRKVK
jgi:hypothetical protein